MGLVAYDSYRGAVEDALGLLELEHLGGRWWAWRLSQTGAVLAVVEAGRG